MSLFKLREFWNVQQRLDTSSKKEEYHHQSLVVGNIDNSSETLDKIITGSFQGILRIYCPTTDDNLPGDLLLEKRFGKSILQISSGQFLPGTRDVGIAILFPRKISVYRVVSNKTSKTRVESGCQLVEQYVHDLPRLSYNFCQGSFGGVYGKDFLCVQSFDGQLAFFEQDRVMFARFLPAFLLPGPIVYFRATDSFITYNSELKVQSVKYQTLVSSLGSEEKESEGISASGGKRVKIDWEVNLGQEVYDVQIGRFSKSLSSSQNEIIVLGERTLFTISQSGKIVSQKPLEYFPSCLLSYFNTNDQSRNRRQNLIIGTHNKSLTVYSDPRLVWMCTMRYVPVGVQLGTFKNNKGMIVTLSREGELSVGYLGTDPATKSVVSVQKKEVDYVKMEKEHAKLKSLIRKAMKGSTETKHGDQYKVTVNVQVPNTLDALPGPPRVTVRIYVLYQGDDPVEELKLNIAVPNAFSLQKSCIVLSNLTGKSTPLIIPFVITRKVTDEESSYAMGGTGVDCSVFAVFYRKNGEPCISQRIFQLPLSMYGELVPPTANSGHVVVFETDSPAVELPELLPDLYNSKEVPEKKDVLTFRYFEGENLTVMVGKSELGKYRFQSNTFHSLGLFTRFFFIRLRAKYEKCEISLKDKTIPLLPYFEIVDSHFEARKILERHLMLLEKTAEQFRSIQKRLLIRYRDRNSNPMNGLDTIFEMTYQDIVRTSDEIQKHTDICRSESEKLSQATSFILFLLENRYKHLTSSDIKVLRSSWSEKIHDNGDMRWEDITFSSLKYLLQKMEGKSSIPQPILRIKETKLLHTLMTEIVRAFGKEKLIVSLKQQKVAEKKQE